MPRIVPDPSTPLGSRGKMSTDTRTHARTQFTVTTLQTEKIPTFLDKIAGNMWNKWADINPNSPQTPRMKNNYRTNEVEVSYTMI